ncbi:ABC transporter permease [Nocardioides ultimimeridianus]
MKTLLKRWYAGSLPTAVSSLAAIVLALLVGALLVMFTESDCLSAIGRGDLLFPLQRVVHSYWALGQGALGGWDNITFTLEKAAPLICAGLGVTLAFRAGLFNIGAQGQLIIGSICCIYVGFHWHMAGGIHLLAALLAGMLGGALWGAIPGILKARTGAHEVIVTMMLNYVAVQLMRFALHKDAFHRPGSDDPTSPTVDPNALFPTIAGVHLGVILALVAAWAVWWLLERSTWGFEMRAVGANAPAARTAGMSIASVTTVVLILSGLLAALGGVMLIQGSNNDLTPNFGATIGFDAITVALLGRATPIGTVYAGILFGALQAGSGYMQVHASTPAELTGVLQALIVLFVAAPALVRSVVRLKIIRGEQTMAAKGWGG